MVSRHLNYHIIIIIINMINICEYINNSRFNLVDYISFNYNIIIIYIKRGFYRLLPSFTMVIIIIDSKIYATM